MPSFMLVSQFEVFSQYISIPKLAKSSSSEPITGLFGVSSTPSLIQGKNELCVFRSKFSLINIGQMNSG